MRTPPLSDRYLTVLTSILFMVALLATSTFAQKRSRLIQEVAPKDDSAFTKMPLNPPVFLEGANNLTCKDLADKSQFPGNLPEFAGIITGEELKFTSMVPGTQSHPLDSNPALSIEITIVNNTTMSNWKLNWATVSALNRLVAAVIVKGGAGGKNVYTYPNLSAGDTGPFVTPGTTGNGLSHISFCFEPFTAPSAAPGSVAGRVSTSEGTGLYGATVMIQNVNTGEVRYTMSNTFGRYSFKDLPLTDFYVMSVSHRRYQFANGTRAFTLDSDLADIDFVAGN